MEVERKIEWMTEPEHAQCRGERECLLEVAGNRVNNAIHYNKPAGRIRVSTFTQDDRIILKVSNAGPGIPADQQPLVFERFYRAEKSRANGGHHSGLGLAIVEAIVKAHGGDVTLESE